MIINNRKIALYRTGKAWKDWPALIDNAIANLSPNSTILEIGGGANPCLTQAQVGQHRYIVIDISSSELAKAKGNYFETKVADISYESIDIRADLVITKMVLEHIEYPDKFHKAINMLTKINGIVMHFYATLYSMASMANAILPDKVSKWLLFKIQNRDPHQEGKFTAYYQWSYGPTKNQIKRLEGCGYTIRYFYGYLGSGYFYHHKWLGPLERLINAGLYRINSPLFCSNAIVQLRKN